MSRWAGVLGQGVSTAASSQTGEPEAILFASSAVQVRRQQYRDDRVCFTGLRFSTGTHDRQHCQVAKLPATHRRRMGINTGLSGLLTI